MRNLATIFIHVTVDETTTPWTVAASPSDIDIYRPTRLVWLLTGNAARGFFPPDTDTKHPAFDLSGSPPFGLFDNGQLSEKQFSLDDHHDGQGPKREWPYYLCIKLGKNYYKTPPERTKSPKAKVRKTKGKATKGPEITKCPRIKNR
jgi:hypothetical protein